MINRQTKKILNQKLTTLTINLENNYKDLAIDALKDLTDTLEHLISTGQLNDKDYLKFKKIVDNYTLRMKDYHH